MAKNNNNLVVKGAKQHMEQFKVEVASQLGLQNYDQLDKGELTSRQNGYVGGNITKKMVAYAETQIANVGAQAMASVGGVTELPERIRLMNQAASQGQFAGDIAAQAIGATALNQGAHH